MDKNNLSESDISDKFVRPALVNAGWHTLEQIHAQFPLRAGRVVVRGNRSQRDGSTVLKADYVLCLKPNIPLAVVEVKKARLADHARLQAEAPALRDELKAILAQSLGGAQP